MGIYSSIKRVFDVVSSAIVLLVLSPAFLIIAISIKLDSKGPVIYKQMRVGKDNCNFYLYKFRSMRVDSDKYGLITVGDKDSRITKVGYFIRKYKLDEFPQLINVIKGNMSIVGPRPVVRSVVELYTPEQMEVLSVRPGLTDPATILYRNESEILASVEDPEQYYRTVIMPNKLKLSINYLHNASMVQDIKLIWLTLSKVFIRYE